MSYRDKRIVLGGWEKEWQGKQAQGKEREKGKGMLQRERKKACWVLHLKDVLGEDLNRMVRSSPGMSP